MKRKKSPLFFSIFVLAVTAVLVFAGCGGGGGGSNGTSPAPSPDPTSTASPSPTSSASPSPTSSVSPSPSPSATTTPSGSVSGNISSYYTGNDLSSATVTLDGYRASTTTDSQGNFSFTDLAPGTYTLSASKAGFFNYSQDIAVTSGKTATADFQMIVMPGAGTWNQVGGGPVSDGLAGFCAIALNEGIPWVAYGDATKSGRLSVKYLNSGAWAVSEVLGFSESTVWFNDLKFFDGVPFVAFMDHDMAGKCTVNTFNGTSWVNVGNAGMTATDAYGITLDFDADGRPAVAYTDFATVSGKQYRASARRFNGTNWVYLGSQGFSDDQAGYTSLKYINGVAHVAFIDGTYNSPTDYFGRVTVLKLVGSTWTAVGNKRFSAGNADYVHMDSLDGEPWVAYSDESVSGKITVSRFNGTSWVNVGGTGFSTGRANCIDMVISGGVPYVCFSDEGNGNKATVMRFDGGNWVKVGNPDFTFNDDWYLHMDVHQGIPYLVYEDSSTGKAVVVRYQEP